MIETIRSGTSTPSRTVKDLVVDYIEKNYADRISLRDVAAAVGYSACHLTTTFREATGTPVTSWIVKRRIVAAQKLLSETNLNVAAACEAAGFGDFRYFRRQFRRQVGLTPGRFRSAMNQTPRAITS
jgi:AraC family transcriptional activator of pobA